MIPTTASPSTAAIPHHRLVEHNRNTQPSYPQTQPHPPNPFTEPLPQTLLVHRQFPSTDTSHTPARKHGAHHTRTPPNHGIPTRPTPTDSAPPPPSHLRPAPPISFFPSRPRLALLYPPNTPVQQPLPTPTPTFPPHTLQSHTSHSSRLKHTHRVCTHVPIPPTIPLPHLPLECVGSDGARVWVHPSYTVVVGLHGGFVLHDCVQTTKFRAVSKPHVLL